ncbi:MAG: SxtJ family membrane protein [Bacteroidetes bacterium]|jgi:hypothetical protein|nr:SxtJ family membrane protein [Bacteroidota bacterium]
MKHLRKGWRAFYAGWMRFAHVLGIVNTTLLLTVVYVLVVLPTRLIWWALRKDPLLVRRTPVTTMWQSREQEQPDLDERRHPF